MVHLLLAVIYLSFISLGLPDGLLGAAWPGMYGEMEVPVSYAGVISMTICMGTIVSSLMSDWLTHKLGTGKVTALSVAATAAALLGFSVSDSFWMLVLWAIPYGLGAGSVDAALNNYVALHYTSRHMSWLHCMWGLGAAIGPSVMGNILSGGGHWTAGYRVVGLLQVVLSAVIFLTLPMWKKSGGGEAGAAGPERLSWSQILKIPGAKESLVTFFGYCSLEQTAALWASSYLALYKGMASEQAAFSGSLFFVGITVGRGLNGFLTMKLSDNQLVRLGEGVIALGIGALLLPMGELVSLAGFILVGLGCAPIYPCLLHATPTHFGEERSQALVGVQMASAYVGSCLTPAFFGVLANHITVALMAPYLLAILLLMAVMHRRLVKICA